MLCKMTFTNTTVHCLNIIVIASKYRNFQQDAMEERRRGLDRPKENRKLQREAEQASREKQCDRSYIVSNMHARTCFAAHQMSCKRIVSMHARVFSIA